VGLFCFAVGPGFVGALPKLCLSVAGGGPAATYFFLLRQEKDKQKEGDRNVTAPAGFPLLRAKKWESFETRCAQTTKLSYSIF
jgi:hypothetical protein